MNGNVRPIDRNKIFLHTSCFVLICFLKRTFLLTLKVRHTAISARCVVSPSKK